MPYHDPGSGIQLWQSQTPLSYKQSFVIGHIYLYADELLIPFGIFPCPSLCFFNVWKMGFIEF